MHNLISLQRWLSLLITWLFISSFLIGQPMEWMPEIRHSNNWKFSSESNKTNATTYIDKLKKSLPDGFDFKKLNDFNFGSQEHIFYQQYFMDIPIEGAQINLHLDNGLVDNYNGFVFSEEYLKPQTQAISEAKLLTTALSEAKGNLEINKNLVGQKIIVKNKKNIYQFVKRYIIKDHYGRANHIVDIDFTMDTIVQSIPLAINCHATELARSPETITHENNSKKETEIAAVNACAYPVGNTRHYGQRVGEVPHQHDPGFGVYRLEDNCRNIKTVDEIYFEGSNSADDTWFAPKEIDPYSAHWAAKVAHDFYYYQLGRNGHYGGGELLKVFVNSPPPLLVLPATLWADPFEDFAIKVVDPDKAGIEGIGHEYTHGILWASKYSNGLVPPSLYGYSEARAITEGICNIMGNEVEAWAAGSPFIAAHPDINADYVVNIDEDQFNEYNFNLVQSSINGTFYKGTIWNPNEGWSQNGNMYRRSNLLGHLFFLLADNNEKPNYTNAQNPNPVTIHIKPLNGASSRHETTLLFYLTAMAYIEANWTFKDFAFGLLEQSAKIYGLCSAQTENVHRALYAVGLTEGPFEIDACGISTGSGTRTYKTPHNLAIGESCNLNYNTGSYYANDTVTFQAGNHIIEGNHTFTGYAIIIFDSLNCQGGAGLPMIGNDIEYQEALIRKKFNDPQMANSINTKRQGNQSDLSIFPNPFNDIFTISFEPLESDQNLQIQIFNTSGQLVIQRNFGVINKPVKESFDLSTFPAGVYLIKIIEGEQVITRKITKQ